MLSRNLLYTALTRARRVLLVVGDQAALRRAAADARELSRQTGLGALLTGARSPSRQGDPSLSPAGPVAAAESGR
jgi:exodeoxyribonuclease V alpha subunit